MLIKCAWCKRITGNRPPYGGHWDQEVTEGICDDCLLRHFPHEYEKVKRIGAIPESEERRWVNGNI